MRIAIMGTGGIGGFLAASLAGTTAEIICIARGDHLAAILKHGLTFIRGDGKVFVHSVHATEEPSSVGPVDLILFCTKYYDAIPAARACLPLLHENTAVIPFQNGVEIGDLLISMFGTRFIGGSILVSCHVEQPGVIHQTGTHASVACGPAPPKLEPVVRFFTSACLASGIEAARVEDVSLLLWTKFVRLASVSAVTAITRQSIGVVRSDPVMRDVLSAAIEEAVAVGKAAGVKLSSGLQLQILNGIQDLPATFKSSQLLDLENERPLEVEWLSGAVHRIGQKHGIPTPVHSTAYAALKPFSHGKPA